MKKFNWFYILLFGLGGPCYDCLTVQLSDTNTLLQLPRTGLERSTEEDQRIVFHYNGLLEADDTGNYRRVSSEKPVKSNYDVVSKGKIITWTPRVLPSTNEKPRQEVQGQITTISPMELYIRLNNLVRKNSRASSHNNRHRQNHQYVESENGQDTSSDWLSQVTESIATKDRSDKNSIIRDHSNQIGSSEYNDRVHQQRPQLERHKNFNYDDMVPEETVISSHLVLSATSNPIPKRQENVIPLEDVRPLSIFTKPKVGKNEDWSSHIGDTYWPQRGDLERLNDPLPKPQVVSSAGHGHEVYKVLHFMDDAGTTQRPQAARNSIASFWDSIDESYSSFQKNDPPHLANGRQRSSIKCKVENNVEVLCPEGQGKPERATDKIWPSGLVTWNTWEFVDLSHRSTTPTTFSTTTTITTTTTTTTTSTTSRVTEVSAETSTGPTSERTKVFFLLDALTTTTTKKPETEATTNQEPQKKFESLLSSLKKQFDNNDNKVEQTTEMKLLNVSEDTFNPSMENKVESNEVTPLKFDNFNDKHVPSTTHKIFSATPFNRYDYFPSSLTTEQYPNLLPDSYEEWFYIDGVKGSEFDLFNKNLIRNTGDEPNQSEDYGENPYSGFDYQHGGHYDDTGLAINNFEYLNDEDDEDSFVETTFENNGNLISLVMKKSPSTDMIHEEDDIFAVKDSIDTQEKPHDSEEALGTKSTETYMNIEPTILDLPTYTDIRLDDILPDIKSESSHPDNLSLDDRDSSISHFGHLGNVNAPIASNIKEDVASLSSNTDNNEFQTALATDYDIKIEPMANDEMADGQSDKNEDNQDSPSINHYSVVQFNKEGDEEPQTSTESGFSLDTATSTLQEFAWTEFDSGHSTTSTEEPAWFKMDILEWLASKSKLRDQTLEEMAESKEVDDSFPNPTDFFSYDYPFNNLHQNTQYYDYPYEKMTTYYFNNEEYETIDSNNMDTQDLAINGDMDPFSSLQAELQTTSLGEPETTDDINDLASKSQLEISSEHSLHSTEELVEKKESKPDKSHLKLPYPSPMLLSELNTRDIVYHDIVEEEVPTTEQTLAQEESVDKDEDSQEEVRASTAQADIDKDPDINLKEEHSEEKVFVVKPDSSGDLIKNEKRKRPSHRNKKIKKKVGKLKVTPDFVSEQPPALETTVSESDSYNQVVQQNNKLTSILEYTLEMQSFLLGKLVNLFSS